MLRAVNDENWQCFVNLSQQYEAEFGGLTGKLPGCDGLYQITLADGEHDAYVAYGNDGNPAGIAVVGTREGFYDMAEFYVIPALRKKGLGAKIAAMMFDRYPGSWQVRQIKGADGAYRFWVSVVSAYSQGVYSDDTEADPEWGQVRIQRLISGDEDEQNQFD